MFQKCSIKQVKGHCTDHPHITEKNVISNNSVQCNIQNGVNWLVKGQ